MGILKNEFITRHRLIGETASSTLEFCGVQWHVSFAGFRPISLFVRGYGVLHPGSVIVSPIAAVDFASEKQENNY